MENKEIIIKFSDAWKLYGTVFDWHYYRHRPTIISAIQMDKPFVVKTPEGIAKGEKGDYLIQGIHEELNICKKEIFEEIYKRA
jgi:hypothetical protein